MYRNKILSNIFVGLGYLFIYKLLICTLALKFSCILTGVAGLALLLVLSYFVGEDIQDLG